MGTSRASAVSGALLLCMLLAAWPAAAAPTPRDYLYVANTASGDISVIGLPEHRLVGTIPHAVVGDHPDDVISSRDGALLFVSRAADNEVVAIDTVTEQLLWRVGVGGSPNHLSLSADQRFLFVPLFDKGELVVVDTQARAVVARRDVGPGAHGTLLGPSGKYVYVGCMGADQLTVVETGGAYAIKRIIALPNGVRPFQVSADERLAYVQLTKLHGFVVVDLEKERVIRTVELPTLDRPLPTPSYEKSQYVMNHGLGISPDGKYLVANATLSGFTAIYSLPDLALLGTVAVGEQPNWVVFSKDARFAYVSNRVDDTVSAISLAERREVARIAVGDYPQRMTVARVAQRPGGALAVR